MNNQSQNPAVSVIIHIRSYGRHLARCLESLSGQSMKNIEVLMLLTSKDEKVSTACREVSGRDERFSVIDAVGHQQGSAYNLGIDNAKGEYVAFVGEHDWADPNMMASLYDLARENDSDAITSFYYSHKEGREEIIRNISDSPYTSNIKVKDRTRIPHFYLKCAHTMGSLYKREFLNINRIRFNPESPDILFAQKGFVFWVYCYMTSAFIYRASLYHYDCSHEAGIEPRPLFKNTLAEHEYILRHAEERNLDRKCLDLEVYSILTDVEMLLNRKCRGLSQSVGLLAMASPLLENCLPHVNESSLMSKRDKKRFRMYAKHGLTAAFLGRGNLHMKIALFVLSSDLGKNEGTVWLFGLPLFYYSKTDSLKIFRCLGIPVMLKRKTSEAGRITRKMSYVLGAPLIKKTETNQYTSTYLLNILVGRKLNYERALTDSLYYAGMANVVSDMHSKVFPQFKNSNSGKSVAILGTGPSLAFAPKFDKCKLLACNRSFLLLEGREPDYIFAYDYTNAQDYFGLMLKQKCYLFVGQFIDAMHNDLYAAPEKVKLQPNVHTFYTAPGLKFYKTMRTEIDRLPLYAFTSIIDPAMQFAFYTSPDVIYLVGCDATTGGYANKNLVQEASTQTRQYAEGHMVFRQFRDTHYPDTRIVSVNPIGLRGIYEDVYTKGFLEQNPDMDKSGVTVIDSI